MRQFDYRDIRPREIPASFTASGFVRDAGWLVKRAVRSWADLVDQNAPGSSCSLRKGDYGLFISEAEAEGPWEEDRGMEGTEKIRRKAL
ncbi:hypothetical protein N7463_004065 [Penicillium fimorum]|uniref:Uncharacterized protein n=1 Tax=Penicillium fimorum TaxID=1882269 RepID=A0A9W9Y2H1_9EURO|nr:hypothetical protein N7463_004065 [Penicillium fimorum]